MAMTPAQQRAIKRYRERRRKHGLRRLEVQVPMEEIAVIRKAAAVLRDQKPEAVRLRTLLGFGPKRGQAASAFDIFAMTETLSPEGEALWENAMKRVARERRDARYNRVRDVDL